MKKINTSIMLTAAALMLPATRLHAKSACPSEITAAVENAYPKSKVTSCKQEKENGKTTYDVSLVTADSKKLSLDLNPDGSILMTEMSISVDSVPVPVVTAFSAKYPGAKIQGGEKQTAADGAVTYEVAFKAKGKKHEVTYKEDGTYLDFE